MEVELPVLGRQEALGIGLGVVGNLLNAVGYVLQKKGWNSKKPTERIWQSGTWVVGFLAYAAGSVVFAVALGFATASMLLPLGGLKLAAFAALAPCVLGEKIGVREIIGILLVIIGAGGAVSTGPSNDGQGADLELATRFQQPIFLIYAALTLTLGLATWCGAHRLRNYFHEAKVEPHDLLHHSGEGGYKANLLALSYALLTGLCSAYGILCIKVLAETLSVGLEEAVKSVGFYCALAAFVLTNFGVEYFKQTALKLFPAMSVIPACEVALLVLGILTTGIFFDEFGTVSDLNLGLFGGSIGISAFGIYFLSASEVEKMPFQKAAAVAMRVAIAKNKLMGLLHKHDEAPACAEAAAGGSTPCSAGGLCRCPSGGFMLGGLPMPILNGWEDEESHSAADGGDFQQPLIEEGSEFSDEGMNL